MKPPVMQLVGYPLSLQHSVKDSKKSTQIKNHLRIQIPLHLFGQLL